MWSCVLRWAVMTKPHHAPGARFWLEGASKRAVQDELFTKRHAMSIPIPSGVRPAGEISRRLRVSPHSGGDRWGAPAPTGTPKVLERGGAPSWARRGATVRVGGDRLSANQAGSADRSGRRKPVVTIGERRPPRFRSKNPPAPASLKQGRRRWVSMRTGDGVVIRELPRCAPSQRASYRWYPCRRRYRRRS